ncbi:MAG: hypothetical protein ACOC41_02415 [Chitinivibrionales bacterium]
MKDKKKKPVDSVAQQQIQDFKRQRKQILILAIMLISGGLLATLAAVIVAGSPVRGAQTGRMVSLTLVTGLIGLFSGFYLIYRFRKLKKMEEEEKKSHSSHQ